MLPYPLRRFCLYGKAGNIRADLPGERNTLNGFVTAIYLADKTVFNLNLTGVRFLVKIMDQNAVNKFVDIFIGQFVDLRVLMNDCKKTLDICGALCNGADRLFQFHNARHKGFLFILVAGGQKGKLRIIDFAEGVILRELLSRVSFEKIPQSRGRC